MAAPPDRIRRRLRWTCAITIGLAGSSLLWTFGNDYVQCANLANRRANQNPSGSFTLTRSPLRYLDQWWWPAGSTLQYVVLVGPWVAFYFYARRLVVRHLTVGHHCWKCDYRLRPPPGATRCPECGFAIGASRSRWEHYCTGRIWTICGALPPPREDDG
jgi:hypothetical protein